MLHSSNPSLSPPSPLPRTLAVAAALVLVVRLQPDLLQRLRGGEVVDPQLAKLVAAVGEERYIEARLTGGFDHAPLRAAMRGSGGLSNRNLTLMGAAGEIQKRAHDEPSVSNLHAWGVAQILLGDYDAAIATLTEAVAARPDDPRLLADTAAAHISRARQLGRPDDWPRALSLAIRAVDLSGSHWPEALFNRAIAAEALNLPAEAERYWKAYLEVETDPEWRREGEQRLRKLRQPPTQSFRSVQPRLLEALARGADSEVDTLVGSYRQQTREWIEDGLLGSWALQYSQQDPLAGPTLEHARLAASSLARTNGDSLLIDSIAMLPQLSGADRLVIAKAYIEYSKGRQLYEAAAMQESARPFAIARDVFRDKQSPLREWAELYLSIAFYYQGAYGEALRTLEGIATRAEGKPWLALHARVNWIQGLVATLQADYQKSLFHYGHTLDLFQRLGESDNEAASHSLLGGVLLYVGDAPGVWEHTIEALKRITPETSRRRQHTQLVSAANKSTRLGLPEAALAFANEAFVVATAWKDPIALVEVANYRARTLLTLNRADEALVEVSNARATLALVRDETLRRRVEAEVTQTEADVLIAADPAGAVEAASRAIDYFSESRSSLRVPRLYKARAEARRRTGDLDGAHADLREGTRRFEEERSRLPRSDRLRLAHSDEVWDLHKLLLAAEIEGGARCSDVLATAERFRAVTLRADAPADSGRSATDLVPADDRQRAILHYSFVPGGLVMIALSRGNCELRRVELDEASAQVLVTKFRSDLAAGARSSTTIESFAGQRLADLLLRPVWPAIHTATALDLVLDGPLHSLPFAALSLSDHEFLIEKMPLRLLTSLSHDAKVRGSKPARAVVSSGSADSTLTLPDLPGARIEAALVATTFAQRGLVVNEVTTADGLLRGLLSADVVHFSGHAVANDEYPQLSRLVIGVGGSEQWVSAEQIATLHGASPSLVFLSACSTQNGRQYGGEGPASLARSFIAAGAHEVVASLWPVDDAVTLSFVKKYYTSWFRGGDAPAALRAATVATLREGGPAARPGMWAAWVAIGQRF